MNASAWERVCGIRFGRGIVAATRNSFKKKRRTGWDAHFARKKMPWCVGQCASCVPESGESPALPRRRPNPSKRILPMSIRTRRKRPVRFAERLVCSETKLTTSCPAGKQAGLKTKPGSSASLLAFLAHEENNRSWAGPGGGLGGP